MPGAFLKPENAKNAKIYSPLSNPNRNELAILSTVQDYKRV